MKTTETWVLASAFAFCCACGRPDGSDHSLEPPPDAPVAVELDSSPGTLFEGTAELELTSAALLDDATFALRVQVQAESVDGGEQVAVDMLFDQSNAGLLFSGNTATPARGTLVSPEVFGAMEAPEAVGSASLSLGDSTFVLSVSAAGDVLTATGHFGLACVATTGTGDQVVDTRWETEFCQQHRDEMGLDSWISAATGL